MRFVVRSAPVVGALLLVTSLVAPVRASEHPPLSEWPVMLRSGPIDIRANDGPSDDAGHWTARNVELRDGHLRLTLDVVPGPVHLPVRSGPAVLFVGIGASGGSGDVGYQQRLRVDTETAPACTGDPCRYRFAVDADLTGLPAMAAAADIDPSVMADVGFTFARTFGDGTWLQVLDRFRPRGGVERIRDGRSMAGTLDTRGLVPVGAREGGSRQQAPSTLEFARRVERLTADLPDRSRSLPTVRVRLTFDAPDCWPYLRLAIHDDQASRPFDAYLLELDPLGTVVSVPDGMTWNVTLYDTGVLQEDPYGGAVPAGPFTTDGQDLDLHARFDCTGEPETRTGTLEVAPAAEPLPVPTVLHHGTWSRSYDPPGPNRNGRPFSVAASDGRFVALDWSRATGWTELTSPDGGKWRSRSVPVDDGIPAATPSLDVRLWSAAEGAVLTAMAPDASGGLTLQSWRRAGPGRWTTEAAVAVGAGEEVRALVEQAGVELMALGPRGSDAPMTQVLRRVDAGAWEAVSGVDAGLVALTATPDGFAGISRAGAGGGDTLVTSADGLAWSAVGSLPTSGLASPALAVVDGRLFLAASDADAGLTHAWLQADDGTWEPVLTALGTLMEHGVAANGSTVAVLTRVGDEYGFAAGTVSADGGRTWDRGEASEVADPVCPLSVAAAGTAIVTGTGRCGASSVATRWRPLTDSRD